MELVSRKGEAVAVGAEHGGVVCPDEGLLRIPGGRGEPWVCGVAADDGPGCGEVGRGWGGEEAEGECCKGCGETCEMHFADDDMEILVYEERVINEMGEYK